MRGAVIMIHEVRLSLRGDLALPTWRKIRCLRCTWATRIEACSGQLRKATRLCSAAAWCRSSRPPINHFLISKEKTLALFSGLPQKLGKRNRTLHHAMLRRYREWVLFRSMPADTLLAEGATDTEADDSTSPVCPNDTRSAKSQHCSCTWIAHSRRLLEDCSKRLHFRNLTTRGEFCLSCTMVSDGRVLSTWPAQPSTAEC